MGACRRVWVAVVVAAVGSLAWTAVAGAAIGRANLDGSGVVPGFISGVSVSSLAVGGGHIYWANPDSHTIGRANLDGSGVEPHFLTVPLPRQHEGIVGGPWAVAVDAGHIYWSTEEVIPPIRSWGYIGRANLDGSGVEPSFINTEGGSGLAVDEAHIYLSWAFDGAGSGTIGRANLDGSGVEPYFVSTGSGFGIAVDRAHIYWAAVCSNEACTGGAIGRANLDGSGVQRNFITGLTAPVYVAVGGGHIYWTNLCRSWRAMCSSDTIGRANLDGSGVQRSLITFAQASLGGLAVDDAHVYWGGSPEPSILAVQVIPHTFTLTGRLVNGRCEPATRANRNRRPCTRPIKLKISYKLNVPASVVFRIQRRVAGRLVKGRCVAPTTANRRNPSCTRLIAYPRQQPLFQTGKAGSNSLTFNGIIVTYDAHGHPQNHKLTPGSYLLTASISPSNNKTTSFRIER